MFGVGFVPSVSQYKDKFLTDVDGFLVMLDRVENIGGQEYVKDIWSSLGEHYTHPLGPFKDIDETPLEYDDTLDARTKVFSDRKKAVNYLNKVLNGWRRPAKHIFYIRFDEGEMEL